MMFRLGLGLDTHETMGTEMSGSQDGPDTGPSPGWARSWSSYSRKKCAAVLSLRHKEVNFVVSTKETLLFLQLKTEARKN